MNAVLALLKHAGAGAFKGKCEYVICCREFCRRWSRSPERKRSKVWRRAASRDSSSSSSDTGGGGQRFLEQEGRRRAGRAGRFGTGAAADARANHVRATHYCGSRCVIVLPMPSVHHS